jgi:rubrerythrin
MLRTHLAVKAWAAIFSIPLLALGACQAEPTTAEPVVALAPEYAGSGPDSGPCEAVLEILDEAIASEIMAYFTYLYAAEQFGVPFTRIRDAELRHVSAVEHLYSKRGLEAPPVVEPEGVPTFETRLLACQAGVAVERNVVALYDELVPLAPTDVARVFLQLQTVSEDHHLEAFLACS